MGVLDTRPLTADALVRHAQRLSVGPGVDPETDMGPLIDEDQRIWVHRHVDDAVRDGAVPLSGGVVPGGPGSFYPPFVLVGPAHDAQVQCQPTRGPVVAVRRVRSFDEALAVAGDCAGAVGVLTPSQGHAQRLARAARGHGAGEHDRRRRARP